MYIALIGVGVVILLGGVAWFFLRPKAVKEEPIYYYRCEGCRRKLKYLARQANNKGMCPMCKRQFVFPPIPVQVPSGRSGIKGRK
jgi:hypothetical protein